MELDEMKSQISRKLATDHTGRSDADIASLLNKPTQSIIGKLKRSLLIEIWGGILAFVVFGYISFISSYLSIRIYFGTFTVLTALFVFLVIHLHKRIKQLSSTTLPVKSNLEQIVGIIEEFSRRYFQFTMALIPVSFVFSLELGLHEKKSMPELDQLSQSIFTYPWERILTGIVFMGLLSAFAYFFTKWYLKKLYGKCIHQLKAYIMELSSD